MNRRRIALILVVFFSLIVTVFSLAPSVKGQDEPYVRSTYMRGPREVTLKTRNGVALCTIQVPADDELSIHVVAERATKPDVFVVGDVAIRVLPVKQMREGDLYAQMMQSPLELNVRDVEVTVK